MTRESTASPSSDKTSKRPKRVSRACNRCRLKKDKCDGKLPCSRCRENSIECVYRDRYRATSGTVEKRRSTPAVACLGSQKRSFSGQSLQNATILRSISENRQIPSSEMYNLMRPLKAGNNFAGNQNVFYGLTSNVNFLQSLHIYLTNRWKPNSLGLSGNSTLVKSSPLDSLLDFNTIFFKQPGDILDRECFANKDTMLRLILSFFNELHGIAPLFIPQDFISTALNAWDFGEDCLCSEQSPVCRYIVSTIFLVMANGAACLPATELISGVSAEDWSTTYFTRGHNMIKDAQYEVTVNSINCNALAALFLRYRGNSPAGYMLIGTAVQGCFSLGIQLPVARFDNDNIHIQDHHKDALHRTWITVYMLACEHSFSIGRQSPVGVTYVNKDPNRGAFFHTHECGDYFDYIELRMRLSSLEMRILDSILRPEVFADLNVLLQTSARHTQDLDIIMKQFPRLNLDSIDNDDIPSSRSRQIWWSRLYYYHIKLVIYRPIMVLTVFLRRFNTARLPRTVHAQLFNGMMNCIDAAIAIPETMRSMSKKWPYLLSMWRNALYLEWSCFVLLFYVITFKDIITEKEVLHLSQTFDTISLCLESTDGPIADSDKLLAADCIKILRLFFPNYFSQDDDVNLDLQSARAVVMNTYLANLIGVDGNNDDNSKSRDDLLGVQINNEISDVNDDDDDTTQTNDCINHGENQFDDLEYDPLDFQNFWESSSQFLF